MIWYYLINASKKNAGNTPNLKHEKTSHVVASRGSYAVPVKNIVVLWWDPIVFREIMINEMPFLQQYENTKTLVQLLRIFQCFNLRVHYRRYYHLNNHMLKNVKWDSNMSLWLAHISPGAYFLSSLVSSIHGSRINSEKCQAILVTS